MIKKENQIKSNKKYKELRKEYLKERKLLL